MSACCVEALCHQSKWFLRGQACRKATHSSSRCPLSNTCSAESTAIKRPFAWMWRRFVIRAWRVAVFLLLFDLGQWKASVSAQAFSGNEWQGGGSPARPSPATSLAAPHCLAFLWFTASPFDISRFVICLRQAAGHRRMCRDTYSLHKALAWYIYSKSRPDVCRGNNLECVLIGTYSVGFDKRHDKRFCNNFFPPLNKIWLKIVSLVSTNRPTFNLCLLALGTVSEGVHMLNPL